MCVRVIQGNGIDLSLFQFDYDLTFAAFFMNADRTIYGRYGTRPDHNDPGQNISLQGFIASLEAALGIHGSYPEGKQALLLKSGRKNLFPAPERYPSLRKFSPGIDYDGQVARSCIHCHQISTAKHLIHRSSGKPFPEKALFVWPMPNVIGLELHPDHCATVKNVKPDSPAQRAGFKSGDDILALAGQPMLSTADLQWVLHNAGEEDRINAMVRRGGKKLNLQLILTQGWRRKDDVSWRGSSWDLRRMVLGGMRLKPLPEARQKGLSGMALHVAHLGQYGEHGVAYRAGLRKGDILFSFDGRDDLLTESSVLAHGLQKRKSGDRVSVKILRGKRRMQFVFPLK